MIRSASALALSFGFVLSGCAVAPPVSPLGAAPDVQAVPYALSPSETKAVKDGVSEQLKDPTSPLFGKVKAARMTLNDSVYVCGYVNAKNSYGGYTGSKPFGGFLVSVGGGKGATSSFLLSGIAQSDAGSDAVRAECAKNGVIL